MADRLLAAQLRGIVEHQLAGGDIGKFVAGKHGVAFVQCVGIGNVRAVRAERQRVELANDAAEFCDGLGRVRVRLEEAPVRVVKAQQQRIGKPRQTFGEVAVSGRRPPLGFLVLTEGENHLRMQMRRVVVVDVVVQVVGTDMGADMADQVADMAGAV